MNDQKKKPRGRGLLSRHPFSLGRYYLLNIAIYSVATAGVLYWNRLFDTVSFWWILSLVPLFLNRFRYIVAGSILLIVIMLGYHLSEISWMYLAFFPVAIYIGHLSAVCIHNAVHNNFKIIWINPIIGELCALQQISAGAPVFRFIHSAHHGYPDDLEKDPHPPEGYTFWGFIDGSRALISNWLKTTYLNEWGDTEKYQNYWKVQDALLLCVRFVKAFFLFSLMGPEIFILLYLPSYLSNVFLFAAFNYYSHVEKSDGSTEILNLDHNLYYQVCNKTLFGIYYHKNHHIRPKLFNPMDMESEIS